MNRGTSRRDYLKLMVASAGLATAAPLTFAQEDATKKPAQQVGPLPGHERRIQWWQEAKFGMFIHWGLYSVIGRHEWAMEVEGVPIPQYEMLAKQFTPKPNAARDWARSGARIRRRRAGRRIARRLLLLADGLASSGWSAVRNG